MKMYNRDLIGQIAMLQEPIDFGGILRTMDIYTVICVIIWVVKTHSCFH